MRFHEWGLPLMFTQQVAAGCGHVTRAHAGEMGAETVGGERTVEAFGEIFREEPGVSNQGRARIPMWTVPPRQGRSDGRLVAAYLIPQ